MAQQNSPSRVRRAQIVSLSLTELMLLLVFMAVAFSFLAKKEGLVAIPRLQAELNDAIKENKRLTSENRFLSKNLDDANAKNQRLTRFLNSINIDTATLKPKGKVIVIGGTSYVISNTTGLAPGHPKCTLKSGFLFNLTLLSDMQIQGTAAWDTAADQVVTTIPGVAILSAGKALSLPEFEAAANALFTSSLAANNCVFAVRVARQTKDADAYDAELTALRKYFYDKRQ